MGLLHIASPYYHNNAVVTLEWVRTDTRYNPNAHEWSPDRTEKGTNAHVKTVRVSWWHGCQRPWTPCTSISVHREVSNSSICKSRYTVPNVRLSVRRQPDSSLQAVPTASARDFKVAKQLAHKIAQASASTPTEELQRQRTPVAEPKRLQPNTSMH